jgi:hypothetical protein
MVADDGVIVQTTDYIFIEIVPSQEYMKKFVDVSDEDKESGASGIEPIFDLIQQGGADQFGLPTIWVRVEGIEVFRGVIEITKDNQATSIDGLATIIPHFQQDCASSAILSSADIEYMKDPYNLVVSGTPASTPDQRDVWEDDRNAIGQINYPITVRPTNEDPYLVFGDPTYRSKKQDE